MDELRKNDVVRASIDDYSSEGYGVARVPQVVFVPGAARGDELEIKIVKAGKNLSYGRLESVIKPSPFRVDPPCPFAGRCGGCSFMHICEQEELELKRRRVKEAFSRIAAIETEPDSVPSPMALGYRNKAAFPVENINGKMKFGFYAPRSHRLVPVNNCLLHSDAMNAAARAVCRWCDENGLTAYDRQSGQGFLRHILIRQTESDLHVCLVAGKKCNFDHRPLVAELENISPLFSGLSLNYNPEDSNRITGSELVILWGKDRLEHRILGVGFSLSPLSFSQVNPQVAELIYADALEKCALDKSSLILDLYCGAGSMTLPFAKRCRRAVGVEIFPQAVRDAMNNARLNGIENAAFICSDAPKAALELKNAGFKPDAVICDPPRKGIGEDGVRAIATLSPARVVYVSCDPATLARDVRELCSIGYECGKPTVYDMFPKTANCETVCLLYHQKKDFISVPYEPKDAEYLKKI